MPEENLLDVQHVAERLDVNPRTVLRMVERGDLPAFKVSHRLRFRPVDLEKYLQSNLSTTTPIVDPTPPQSTQGEWFDARAENWPGRAVSAAATLEDATFRADARQSKHSMQVAQLKLERQ